MRVCTMSYHITGLISSAIFLLTIGGLWAQLGFVWRRKRSASQGKTDEYGQRVALDAGPDADHPRPQFVGHFVAQWNRVPLPVLFGLRR